ncbi:MAG TPA: DUF1501 domain-containing protein [Pirellulales bacterium]|nr:DUF1501 domain-containing protein [Pirellulales bacterium]
MSMPLRVDAWSSCSRRDLLRSVTLGGCGLSLPAMLRSRAAAAPATRRDTAVIFIQLGGGASQFETYDPKPQAPAEYRGAFASISTSVPGIAFSELMPEQAKLMDKLAVVRSVHHHEASHIALHVVETGYFLQNPRNSTKGEMPCIGAIVARTRGEHSADLPPAISLPKPLAYSDPHYLGARYNWFAIDDDPNTKNFRVQNLQPEARLNANRLKTRQSLWSDLTDAQALANAAANGSGEADAIDEFTRQAFELLLGARMQSAIDIGRESDATRDAYGRTPLGQRLLLARRLAEAGAPMILVRMFGWDDHEKLDRKMRERAPEYDRGVAALVRDLHARGLDRRVLVVAMGEFGRTPRVNGKAGRDHWPGTSSVLLAGGHYRMGQALGASDAKGAVPIASPYAPQSVLTMVYRHLGIDPAATFNDFNGRPRYILEERTPIAELG